MKQAHTAPAPRVPWRGRKNRPSRPQRPGPVGRRSLARVGAKEGDPVSSASGARSCCSASHLETSPFLLPADFLYERGK